MALASALMLRTERFLFCLATLCILAISPTHAEIESDEPRDAYPTEFHDKYVDFVVGKAIKIDGTNPDMYARYQIVVAADMTGTIRKGTTISMRGGYLGAESSGSYALHVLVGQTAVFFVKDKVIPGEFEYVHERLFPFGVRSADPAIAPGEIPLVAAALKEMAANLAAPGGAGMPLDRARALLKDKNPYLRALASWRLVHHLEGVDDLNRIEERFQDPAITPAEALFLEELLETYVTGPAQAYTPTLDDRLGMLRTVLQNQAKAKVAEATPPMPTTRP